MNGHDPKCLHRDTVQRSLSPQVCTYCQLIREVRAEHTS